MNSKGDSFGLFVLSFCLGCFFGFVAFYAVIFPFDIVVDGVQSHSAKGDTLAADTIRLLAFFVAAVAGTYVCANTSGKARPVACLFLGMVGSVFSYTGIAFAMTTPDWFFYVRTLLIMLGTLIGYVLGTHKPFIDRLAARL